MSDQSFLLVWIAVLVLLPMLPAIAIFKLLPSHAAVSGPLQGFKINLGGAFAAYFVVLLLLLGLFRAPPTSRNTQVWRVTGTVRFSDQEGVPFETVRLSLFPPTERVASDGTFNIKVLATMPDGGELELPDLRIEAPGYKPVSVSLDREKQKSMAKLRVDIEQPIELRPQPDHPYRATQPLQPEGGNQ